MTDGRTDGQTVGRSDGQTESIIAKTALCIASYADALSKIESISLSRPKEKISKSVNALEK